MSGRSVDKEMMFYRNEEMEEDTSNREENQLHCLYRTLQEPEKVLQHTQELCEAEVDVNALDRHGNTPLSYLVLHINRGLRYHAYTIPQIQRLVDLNASMTEIEDKCIELDYNYQIQVYSCIELLLSKGADVNFSPERCPSIAHDILWTKAYENKLLQQEGRWNLLDRGIKMDYTKFSFFDPLSCGKVENENKLSILQLASWRGDSECIKLLLQAGADVNHRAVDGRNALHFLYQYCNKPGDLVKATALLIKEGISVSVTDSYGHAPFQTILKHCLINRSYVKYLANSYTPEYQVQGPQEDHYRTEVMECIDLLQSAGQDINHRNKWLDGAIHILLYNFQCSLEDAEEEFQVRGHYLVPYQFRINPVKEMMEFLLQRGYNVNTSDTHGRCPLHYVVQILQPLCLHDSLNTVQDVIDCLDVLIKHGAEINAKTHFQQTVAHSLAQVITTKFRHVNNYTEILEYLIHQGLNLNIQDRFGKAVLHYIIQAKSLSYFNHEDLKRLLLLLLRSGADPNLPAEPLQGAPGQFLFYEGDQKYPLTLLLRLHVYHHDDLSICGASQTEMAIEMDKYLSTMEILCQCMRPATLQRVFYQYCDNGFYGVFCESPCPVFQVLYRNSSSTRSLRHLCRLVVWEAGGHRLNRRLDELPLPRELRDYVMWRL